MNAKLIARVPKLVSHWLLLLPRADDGNTLTCPNLTALKNLLNVVELY